MTMNDPRDQAKYQVGGDQYKTAYDRSGQGSVDAQTVNAFHDKSDSDSSQAAKHHSLGTKHDQASCGDHDHDGANSKKIMKGITVTGAKGGNVALANLITALAAALGFTDNTT